MIQKGQNLRLFINNKCIAVAKSCTMHISADLEDVSSKDSTGDWKEQECTGKSWDGSAEALMKVPETDTSANNVGDLVALIGTKVAIQYTSTTGTMNRELVSGKFAYYGEAIVNDISINAGNKANVTYSIQFTGVGALTSGQAPSANIPD